MDCRGLTGESVVDGRLHWKHTTLLCLGVALSEEKSSALLKAHDLNKVRTNRLKDTGVDLWVQSVMLNHMPKYSHEKLLN